MSGGGCPMGFTAGGDSPPKRPHKKSMAHSEVRPKRGTEPVNYHDYLQLDKVLDGVAPQSLKVSGQTAHDEHLFIIIHQTYELWFKQVLFEIDSILAAFSGERVREEDMHTVVARLQRVVEILKVLVQQIQILETMTPLSFLDFRDYLFPASGFQSLQFRLVENKLGLRRRNRIQYNRAAYDQALKAEHRELVRRSEEEPSVLERVNQWLERMPWLQTDLGFDFFASYRQGVDAMLDEDRKLVDELYPQTDNSSSSSGGDNEPTRRASGADVDEERKARLADIEAQRTMFAKVLDQGDEMDADYKSGKRSLSKRGFFAALMINLYRDEPIFQQPFQLFQCLMDIDTHMTNWRYRHALMVQRMLGMKMGTGGSSGYHYLKSTASHHKVFSAFSDMSMYLIPRSAMPALPRHIRRQTGFTYGDDSDDEAADAGGPVPAAASAAGK